MLSSPYYAKNYASIIDASLVRIDITEVTLHTHNCYRYENYALNYIGYWANS